MKEEQKRNFLKYFHEYENIEGEFLQVYSLLTLIELRENIFYIFGLFCLISWFIFNLWILRDYFFPWWFKPIYTDKGFNKTSLERKKMEYLRRKRINNVFAMSVSIVVPNTVQSSIQNTALPLKHKTLKSQGRPSEFRQNSQILNPAALSIRQITNYKIED
ncbi:unnamed protein product [Onchocerca flexuosa]|uniref:Uncharacterized protein n=1 Tax=Onchocerca flexuosa TaxID=387005 RepID=A0A183H1I3_9BILA|nr:unnamed protein product [Onchocerca flexuosa]